MHLLSSLLKGSKTVDEEDELDSSPGSDCGTAHLRTA